MRILTRLILPAALLSGSALLQPDPAIAQANVEFTYEDSTYRNDNLPAALRQTLHEVEVEANAKRRQAINEYVFKRYLRELAARRNISVEALQAELFSVETPDEAGLKAFYEGNKGRIQGSFEQVRAELSRYLQNQQVARLQGELLQRIRKEKSFSLRLEDPEPPRFEIRTEGFPRKGGENAAVTVVEFADYQCPHCKDASEVIPRLLEEFGDRVRFVFRDFPINRSGASRKVAIGAVCAAEQARFWDYHDLAFERQEYLRVIKPEQLAKELGLDAEAFKRCYDAPPASRRVAESEQEGDRLGLTGTPTFFVNGRRLQIQGDIGSTLRTEIRRELGESS